MKVIPKNNFIRPKVETYFKRFQAETIFSIDSETVFPIIIIIPAFAEPDLDATIESLKSCQPTEVPILIFIVLNAGSNAKEAEKELNFRYYKRWKALSWLNPWLALQAVLVHDLNPKVAGVGLARKIGMDSALKYFATHQIDGLLFCLDADCLVSENYLFHLERFLENAETQVAIVHFEHQQPNDVKLACGIVHYENFLRYYAHALRASGYPFWFYTIGSSMGVKASAYAAEGGMNQRKAGEDFYFLHKLFPKYKTMFLNKATVFPQARISVRVPFGTGRFQSEFVMQEDDAYSTYNHQVFKEVEKVLSAIHFPFSPDFYEKVKGKLHQKTLLFLEKMNFETQLAKSAQQSGSEAIFKKRVFQWLDGLFILKLVHCLAEVFPNQPIETVLPLAFPLNPNASSAGFLNYLRELDKSLHTDPNLLF